MGYVKLSPEDYPTLRGESWWIVHPNNSNCAFCVPEGAMTVCIDEFLNFKKNIAYAVVCDALDNKNGWIKVIQEDIVYEMPHYLFRRHFDSEVFVYRECPIPSINIPPFDFPHTIYPKYPNYEPSPYPVWIAKEQISYEYNDNTLNDGHSTSCKKCCSDGK